jgi:voltage-gated potassium channel
MAARISRRRSLANSIILLTCVLAVGTLGYHFFEGWPIFDSLYMTVITITTIGYGEVHRMTEAGRVFTVVLIFFSVGAVFYALNNAAQILIEGELKELFGRRKVQQAINALKEHYIVCGYGRMGRIVCGELSAKDVPFVVIEKDGGDPTMPVPEGMLVIQGDATRDETLLEAGIERAKGLISVLPTDAENLYIVLSARGMNPRLTIVARAVDEGSDKKLRRAGANRVVSPYHIGGLRIAHTLLKPAVVDFIEFSTQGGGSMDLQIEEVLVTEGSALAGQTLAESGIGRELGIIIVAIKLVGGALRFNPTYDTVITVGDTLIAIGEEARLKQLENKAAA